MRVFLKPTRSAKGLASGGVPPLQVVRSSPSTRGSVTHPRAGLSAIGAKTIPTELESRLSRGLPTGEGSNPPQRAAHTPAQGNTLTVLLPARNEANPPSSLQFAAGIDGVQFNQDGPRRQPSRVPPGGLLVDADPLKQKRGGARVPRCTSHFV